MYCIALGSRPFKVAVHRDLFPYALRFIESSFYRQCGLATVLSVDFVAFREYRHCGL